LLVIYYIISESGYPGFKDLQDVSSIYLCTLREASYICVYLRSVIFDIFLTYPFGSRKAYHSRHRGHGEKNQLSKFRSATSLINLLIHIINDVKIREDLTTK